MKKRIFFVSLLGMLIVIAAAQAPQLFNYQAIARDASGNAIVNQAITIRLTIYDSSPSGTMVYQETQSATTSAFGLFTLSVGGGTVTSGTFSAINWVTGNKFMQVELDPAGGSTFTDMGTTELLSVPYALYAASAGSNSGNDGNGWSLTGNAGTSTSTNFIGTTDAADLVFKISGAAAGFIESQNNNRSTALGYLALSNETPDNQNYNTAFGAYSLSSNTLGVSNVANGAKALYSNTSGSFNTADGQGALYFNNTGEYNAANGALALYYNTAGSNNSAIGYQALYYNNASNNTADGYTALFSNLGGHDNVANGTGALYTNRSGANNAAVGSAAMALNVSGNDNTAIGSNALWSNTASENTAIGASALYFNTGGYDNTANGYGALYTNVSGNYNTANGYEALYANTAGYNTANGYNALYKNTIGVGNTAIGLLALGSNTTGNYNTAIGYEADVSGTGLTNATAVGANTVVSKSNALVLGGTGSSAVDVGIGTDNPGATLDVESGATTTLSNGIVDLFQPSLSTGNSVYLKLGTALSTSNEADLSFNYAGSGSGSNSFGIGFYGNSAIVNVLANGKVGINVAAPSYTLQVNGSVAGTSAYVNTSDERLKKNITKLESSLQKIIQLQGVSYDWRTDEFPAIHFDMRKQLGLVAQQVEKIVPEAVSKDKDGYYGISYSTLVPLLIEAIKEQQQTIDALVKKNEETGTNQNQQIKEQGKANEQMLQMIGSLQNEMKQLKNR